MWKLAGELWGWGPGGLGRSCHEPCLPLEWGPGAQGILSVTHDEVLGSAVTQHLPDRVSFELVHTLGPQAGVLAGFVCPIVTLPESPAGATRPLSFGPTPHGIAFSWPRARWGGLSTGPVDTSWSRLLSRHWGSWRTPSTLWLFRENSACVEGNIMAQKTEDPAVFTIDCKYPHPVPVPPPSVPLRRPWKSSAPSRSGPPLYPCFSCAIATKGAPGVIRPGDPPPSGAQSPPGPRAPCMVWEDSRAASGLL